MLLYAIWALSFAILIVSTKSLVGMSNYFNGVQVACGWFVFLPGFSVLPELLLGWGAQGFQQTIVAESVHMT